MGLMGKTHGSAMFKGKELLTSRRMCALRWGSLTCRRRRIVQGLSVRENLRLGLVASPQKKKEAELIEGIAEIFRGSPSAWTRKR